MQIGVKCLKNKTAKLPQSKMKFLVINCCIRNYLRTYWFKQQWFLIFQDFAGRNSGWVIILSHIAQIEVMWWYSANKETEEGISGNFIHVSVPVAEVTGRLSSAGPVDHTIYKCHLQDDSFRVVRLLTWLANPSRENVPRDLLKVQMVATFILPQKNHDNHISENWEIPPDTESI